MDKDAEAGMFESYPQRRQICITRIEAGRVRSWSLENDRKMFRFSFGPNESH